MLYTVVVFVVLFLVAAIAAVAYYMKYEQQRKVANDATNKMREMAKDREWQTIAQTVGQKDLRDSYLAALLGYVDDATGMILGKPLEQTSVEVKLQTAKEKYLETLNTLAQEPVGLSDLDPNTIGLTRIAERLKAKLTDSNDMLVALNNNLQQLQGVLAETKRVSNETQRKLIDEKEQYRQQVEQIKKDYEELSALTKQTSSEQIQTIITERDQARNEVESLNGGLMQMEAKLRLAHDRLEDLQKQVWSYMGPPDSNVPAYKPDGHIMLVDNQIVHLDIGTDDRVYRGLTFAVYDKAIGIHKNGKGKAEIEVFDVRKNVSQARVVRSQVKRPIVVDDIVANLIWDSDKTYNFVVQGEFDLNGDGQSEYDAIEKIAGLIESWGGQVIETVSVDTDYVVLGGQPRVLKKPTFEDMEADPAITEKYEASVRKYEHYNQVQKRAAELWIPVFNTERFLYFIGYKTLAARPTAFLSKTTD
jgi:predicted RNase H-related nuclease YkuK (DUF458 family)